MKESMNNLKETMNSLLDCLILRYEWYQETIDVRSGKVRPKVGKDYAPYSAECCEGAAAELKNTIAMLKHDLKEAK